MIRFVKRGLFMLALGALGLLLTRPVHADGLPKGEDILDQYVTVTGGKEAYDKIKNRVITGTFEIPAQGFKGKITIYATRPNKMYTVLELGGLGKVEEGTDGKVVWEKSLTGPRLKTGAEKAKALRDATFDSDAQWRKLYKKAECVAEEKIDGKPCYKVELTTQEGTTRTAYYDKQSNLAVKMVSTEKAPMGEVTIEIFPSDYKKVDGILMPHKLQHKMVGMDMVLTFEKVEQNVKIPDNRFDLPEDIKKLADKEK